MIFSFYPLQVQFTDLLMCGLNSCCFCGLSRDTATRQHWLKIYLRGFLAFFFLNDSSNSFHYIPKRLLDSKDIKYMHISVNKLSNMFRIQISVEAKY